MHLRRGPGELDKPSCLGLCWRSGFEVEGHGCGFGVADVGDVRGLATHVSWDRREAVARLVLAFLKRLSAIAGQFGGV
jgi:hypothetical protein